MNYKVLYRKYRPKTFDEIVGQNNIITLLKDSIINNKISHAYIFSGPRGTGKTSTAKIFAKAINCLDNTNGNPCLNCEICSNFNLNNDIYEIDAASNTGVDQIREIIDNVKLSPITSKYKVYIIDEVHMLSTSAFNALLLTLEEPPSHVVFILATTNIEDVPITVLSRCQRLDFRKIANKDIHEQLIKVSKEENIDISDEAIEEITNYSDGGMRDALSILDQLSKLNKRVEYDDVICTLGTISNNDIKTLIDDMNENNAENIIKFVDRCRDLNVDYKTLVKKIIKEINIHAVDIKLNRKIYNIDYDTYQELSFKLTESLYKTNINVDIFGMLELILLSYINTNVNKNTQSSIKNEVNNSKNIVENEEKVSTNVKIVEKTPKIEYNLTNLESIRINNCFVNASKEEKIKSSEKWNEFLNTYENKKILGLIEDAKVVLASSEIIVLLTQITALVNEINANISSLEDDFNKSNNTNYKFIATSNENWLNEMEKYKNNIKNNIKYQFIEENAQNIEYDDIIDVFNKKKIEES